MSSVAVVAPVKSDAVDASRLFVGSCVALSGSAVMFAVLNDIMGALKEHFVLTNEQVGWVAAGQMGFTIAIFAAGPLCDALGHEAAAVVRVPLPDRRSDDGHLRHRLLDAVQRRAHQRDRQRNDRSRLQPAHRHALSNRKTQKLNQFHVWWPGGIVLGGLACYALDQAGLNYWQLKVALVVLPTLAYGVMLAGQKFPATERVQSGVSFGQMFGETFLRPLFLVLLVCMMLTASLELGPQRWIPSVLEAGHVPGILVLVWITGLMAVMRFFNAPVEAHAGGIGVLLVSLSACWRGSGDAQLRRHGVSNRRRGDGFRDRSLLFLADDARDRSGARSTRRGAGAGRSGRHGKPLFQRRDHAAHGQNCRSLPPPGVDNPCHR